MRTLVSRIVFHMKGARRASICSWMSGDINVAAVFLGPAVEPSGVARGVLAQIRHGAAQTLDQHIKDFAEFGKVRLLAEHLDEAGEVIVFGDASDGGDAE